MPTSSSTIQTQASIDGGPMVPAELAITLERENVRSRTATKPDMDWVYVDPNGHLHRFADDGTLPTLTSRLVEMPCDGSCGDVCGGEGYTVIEYSCALCGAEVQPRTVPDVQAREFGIPILTGVFTTLTVRGEIPRDNVHAIVPGEEVPVSVVLNSETGSGYARRTDVTIERSAFSGGTVVTTVYDVRGLGLEHGLIAAETSARR